MSFYSHFMRYVLTHQRARYAMWLDTGASNHTLAKWMGQIRSMGQHLMNGLNIHHCDLDNRPFYRRIEQFENHFDAFAMVYEMLQDQKSRDLYIEILAFRMMGCRFVQLPLGRSSYRAALRTAERLAVVADSLEAPWLDGKTIRLYRHDLQPIGYPLSMYAGSAMVARLFLLHHYDYSGGRVNVRVEPDDIVLDCGASIGDATLAFAYRTGEQGHVYSFEVLPGNLAVLHKNLVASANLGSRISIVDRPLWCCSGEMLFYEDSGPASRIHKAAVQPGPRTGTSSSISIDDFVREQGLTRVSFVKMDIEGAELMALQGCIETLKRFKPKLAISIYHSLEDLHSIPSFVNDLNLGYRLYVGHYTPDDGETVLYAAP